MEHGMTPKSGPFRGGDAALIERAKREQLSWEDVELLSWLTDCCNMLFCPLDAGTPLEAASMPAPEGCPGACAALAAQLEKWGR